MATELLMLNKSILLGDIVPLKEGELSDESQGKYQENCIICI